MTFIPNIDFYLEVAKGNIPKHSIIQRFGERDNFGTTTAGQDIWRGNELTPSAAVRVPLIAAAGVLISWVSQSTADNGATATGILTFEVDYIDVTGNEQTWTGTSNGTTPVDSTILMRHINDVRTKTVGSGGVAAGHCKVYLTGDTTTVYSMIQLGGNHAMITNYMVPLGKKLYCQEWDCTEANGKRLTMRPRSTSHDGVLIDGVFLFKDVAFIKNGTTGELKLFCIEPALSIIKVSGWSVTAGGECSAGFWGYLVQD